jgi:hypothetical protein
MEGGSVVFVGRIRNFTIISYEFLVILKRFRYLEISYARLNFANSMGNFALQSFASTLVVCVCVCDIESYMS